MTLNNLILHITLPKGLKTTDGATLNAPVTFDIASQLSPFYASVEQVKLIGGYGLRKLSDITIAAQIYMSSKVVDMMNYRSPSVTTDPRFQLFTSARNQWVTAKAAVELILSLGDLLTGGSHVLANFSVTQAHTNPNEGTAGKLTELQNVIKFFDPSIRSGGRIEPGGHARPVMAAKGVMDWSERTPARQWSMYGAGANMITEGGGSNTGGRGHGASFYSTPLYSAPIIGFRVGSIQAGLSLECRNTCFGN